MVDAEFLEWPRAVSLDVKQTQIYFTDWGKKPALYRADYYGNQISVVSNMLPDMPIKNPNGVFSMDKERLNILLNMKSFNFNHVDIILYPK